MTLICIKAMWSFEEVGVLDVFFVSVPCHVYLCLCCVCVYVCVCVRVCVCVCVCVCVRVYCIVQDITACFHSLCGSVHHVMHSSVELSWVLLFISLYALRSLVRLSANNFI